MRSSTIFLLFSSSVLVASSPITTFHRHFRSSVHPRGVERRAEAVKKWAALGDSYASGIGAGVRGSRPGDLTCSRYTKAYLNVVNADLDGTDSSTRQFQDVACGGAVTTAVKDTQANAFDKDVDIATLSVGLTDIGFADVLNACIFLFYISVSCRDQINNAKANIDSQSFHSNLADVASAILDTAQSPHFRLYWLGYAQFWNPDTVECNPVTWSYWDRTDPPRLTQQVHKQLNDLTTQLNNAIKDAVDRANSKHLRRPLFFVDYNSRFDTHRYCDDGVAEPDPTRAATWFFESDTTEAYTVTESHNFPDGSLEKQFQDWIDQQANADKSLKPASQGSHWIADSLAKFFHPRVDGQAAIKDAVLAAYTTYPPAIAAPAPAPTGGDFSPGWCVIHVVQFQKHERDPRDNQGPDYVLDVSVYDAKKPFINIKDTESQAPTRIIAPTGIPQTIHTKLLKPLNFTTGPFDNSTVDFEYDDQKWGSNDQAHHSNFGEYALGQRQGKTGFTC